MSSDCSTDTKVALTLLTCRLEFEDTEVSLGDRPRLGGEMDRSVCLVSKMAQRFLTADEVDGARTLPVDMTRNTS